MGFLSKATPPAIPTDEIVPFHYWDDQFHTKALLFDFTYRFDDVLDAQKLKNALERLLEIGDWKKLGGRIRRSTSGKLEYHIPQQYNEKRPGFLYDHVEHHQSIEEHPLASRYPRAKTVPTVFGAPAEFHEFAHPLHPTSIDGFLSNDYPPLSLRIVSFHDATILTLSWSHTLLDAVGCQSLFKAWIAVLEGRESEIPRFIGFKDDPIDAVGSDVPASKHVLYDSMLTGFGFFMFVVSTILELVLHPKKESRLIQIPDSYVQRLKREAREDLKQISPSGEGPFLSDGDVLFAWWTRLTVSCLNISGRRTIVLLNVFNLRGIAERAFPSDGAFIGNAAASINTYMPTKQLLERSLGSIALELRGSLEEQRTTEQVEALVALHKHCTNTIGRPPIFGPWDQLLVSWSNWHRARFFDFDFSAAVVRQGRAMEARDNKVGKPSLISICGHENGFQIRNGGSLMGRDNAGNWWILWSMRAKAWPAVREKVASLAHEDAE